MLPSTPYQPCKSQVLAAMVRHEEDVPCGEALGIRCLRNYCLSRRASLHLLAATREEDKATAMLLVRGLGADSGLTKAPATSGPKETGTEVETGACVVGRRFISVGLSSDLLFWFLARLIKLAVFASAQRARERRPGKLLLCFCISDGLGSGKSRQDALRSSRDNDDDQPQQLTDNTGIAMKYLQVDGDSNWYLAVPC